MFLRLQSGEDDDPPLQVQNLICKQDKQTIRSSEQQKIKNTM
jgi:hypothetical protein